MQKFTRINLVNVCFFILIITCELISSEVPRPRGVSLSRAALYDPLKDFSCFDGTLTIPFSQVNDDYCDCPDASDEPGTSACPHGTFYCLNAGHEAKNIPSNRVNDGICDCCDTSDEYSSSADCTNICDELGHSAREDARKLAELIKIGSQLRVDLSQRGTEMKSEKQKKLSELEKSRTEAEHVLLEKESLKKNVEEEESAAVELFREREKELKEAEEAEKSDIENEAPAGQEEQTSEHFEAVESNSEGPKDAEEETHELLDEETKEGGEEDEEDEEEAAEAPEEVAAPEQLVYDEETQKIVDRANEARKEFETARKVVQDLAKEIDNIREYLDKDFGPDNEFAPLEGQCFEYEDREYKYKLCPFDKTTQQPKQGSVSETRLGVWSTWEDSEHKKYHTMIYENGQNCWNGPDRSTKVKVTCGSENKLLSVVEPNRCEYLFEFSTPAACRDFPSDSMDLHDEL